VVIAIIAILAALLLPALAMGRAHARSASCENHLHQMGLALRMYVDQNGKYPRSIDVDRRSGNVLFWFNGLAPFYRLQWTNTAYHCPGYKGAIQLNETDSGVWKGRGGPVGSYAYNAFGLRLTDGGGGAQPNSLGLGPIDRRSRVISDAQIVAPAEMFSIGESRFVSKGVNHVPGGADYMVRGLLVNTPPWIKFDPARHGKTYNQLFVDGHVAQMNPWALYDCAKSGAMWNNDHQPHPELWR
jgi:prepilin-type processing-associated H-X9-DG protein